MDNVGMLFSGFLFISTHISLDLLSLGSAEAYIGWDRKLDNHLMASCVRNIRTKNYQNFPLQRTPERRHGSTSLIRCIGLWEAEIDGPRANSTAVSAVNDRIMPVDLAYTLSLIGVHLSERITPIQ